MERSRVGPPELQRGLEERDTRRSYSSGVVEAGNVPCSGDLPDVLWPACGLVVGGVEVDLGQLPLFAVQEEHRLGCNVVDDIRELGWHRLVREHPDSAGLDCYHLPVDGLPVRHRDRHIVRTPSPISNTPAGSHSQPVKSSPPRARPARCSRPPPTTPASPMTPRTKLPAAFQPAGRRQLTPATAIRMPIATPPLSTWSPAAIPGSGWR